MSDYKKTKELLFGDSTKRIAPQTQRAIKDLLAAGRTPKEAAAAIERSWQAEFEYHVQHPPMRMR